MIKFKTSTRSVNDGLFVQKHGELEYYFGEFLEIETSFDFKYYNTCFDAWIKSYSFLKLQTIIISFIFLKLLTTIDLLFSSRTNKGWTKKMEKNKNIQRIKKKTTKWIPKTNTMTTNWNKKNTSMEKFLFLWFGT